MFRLICFTGWQGGSCNGRSRSSHRDVFLPGAMCGTSLGSSWAATSGRGGQARTQPPRMQSPASIWRRDRCKTAPRNEISMPIRLLTDFIPEPMPFESGRPRPKILFVTSHWPLAPAYGAQQRVLNIGRLLSRFGDVSYVIVSNEREDEETALRTKREFNVRKVIRPVPAASATSFGRLLNSMRNEIDPTYIATDPYVASESDRAALQELIQQHDLVWVHTIRTANWFRIYKWPHSVLDVDDLTSRALWSVARLGGGSLKRLRQFKRYWNWRRRERHFLERFDVLTVCSEDDRRYLGGQERIHVIPNGFSPLTISRHNFPNLPRIGFIGNFGHPPNQHGIRWFMDDVWPSIKRDFPSAQLRLVGRGTEEFSNELGSDITGLGWLEDPGEEIATWSAMIVPIKVGSGTRVKVAEGFARGCPIVATAIGAFGFEVTNGVELLQADSAEEFSSACVSLLRNPQLGEALAGRAHKRFVEKWTWDSFESTVGSVVQECLTRTSRDQLDRVIAAS